MSKQISMLLTIVLNDERWTKEKENLHFVHNSTDDEFKLFNTADSYPIDHLHEGKISPYKSLLDQGESDDDLRMFMLFVCEATRGEQVCSV